MLDCIRDSLARNGFTIAVIAAIMGVLGGLAAIGGGLVIIAGPVSATVGGAVLAGLAVFGIIVAGAVAVIIIGCALGATAPSVDQDPPPVSGSGEPTITSPLTEEPADPPADDPPEDPPKDPPPPGSKHPEGPPRGSPANPAGGGKPQDKGGES